MKQKLFLFLAMFFASFATFAQTSTLSLGGYEDASVDNDSKKYDATNIYNAPIIPTYHHSGVQFIYTAEELKQMSGNQITALKFKYYAETTEDYASHVKVYLQEVDQDAFQKDEDGAHYLWFAYDEAKPAAEADFSFSGTDLYMADGEMVLDLSAAPFKYSGKNLLVTVVNDGDGFLDPSAGFMAFYCYDVNGARIATYAKDDVSFEENQQKDLLVKDGQENMLTDGLPVVQFAYQPATTDPEPPADGTLTLGEFDNEEQTEAWDGFNLQNAPVLFNYNYSGSQVLYLPSQLETMKGKGITSMTFALFNEGEFTTTDYNSHMKLYLQEIDDVAFEKKDKLYYWFPFSAEAPTVEQTFSQDFTQAAVDGTDIHITFDLSQAPFLYTGKTLLVTVVNDNDTDTPAENSGLRFRWIKNKPEDDWRTFIYGSDHTTFIANQEKGLEMGTYDNEDKWKNAPAVQFTFKDMPVEGIHRPVASTFVGAKGATGCIELQLAADTQVQLYAITGQIIKRHTYKAGLHTIDVNPGIYLVKAGKVSQKVVVR